MPKKLDIAISDALSARTRRVPQESEPFGFMAAGNDTFHGAAGDLTTDGESSRLTFHGRAVVSTFHGRADIAHFHGGFALTLEQPQQVSRVYLTRNEAGELIVSLEE